MPPGTGDVPLTVFQSLPLDGIIVVTSPQELVSMIVAKAVNMAKMMNIPVLGLIENMAPTVSLAAFLDSVKSTASGTFFPPHHSLALKCADLPTHKPHCLDTLYQRRALSILLCPHFTQTTFGGTGISTSCPSPTTLVLGLGPD